MVESQREREERLRREAANRPTEKGTGGDSSFVAVDTVPGDQYKKTTTTTERITPGMTPEDRARMAATTAHTAGHEDKPMTQKVGDTLHEAKEDIKDVVTPGRTEGTRGTDWDQIQHPGKVPRETDPYGTRPVSELTPPPVVTDKADLAAVRMMERERKTGTGTTGTGMTRTEMDECEVMTTATEEAAAARMARERERERTTAGAAATGAALAAGAAATRTTRETTTETVRTEPAAGERTTRQGAAIDTEPTRRTTVMPPPVVTPPATDRPVTRTVVPPGVTTTAPLKPYGTVDERERMHAEDPSVHPDWETQPQINAPRDVGIPTAEGQADAARLRSGQRRSDTAQEPRIDRRGGEYEVPAASGARVGKDDRSLTEKAKDAAHDVKESTKETARDVKRDVDRKV